MIRVNRWAAAALTATFLLLALLMAGTTVLQAAPIERRAVNKLVKDFPEKTDLSTPETVMATWSRNLARKDIQAVLELSWVKMDARTAKDVEDALKYDPNAPKNLGPLFLDTEIIDVLTYHDDFAVVICKGNLDGAGPYGGVPFGKINGVWKNLSLGLPLGDSPRDWSSPSVKAVTERVEKKKDDLWRQFVEIRNDVLNGRIPMFDAKGRVASADSTKSEETTEEKTSPPPTKKSAGPAAPLSAAEKEEMERWQVENWHLKYDLDMPSLEPQAVQVAIFDKDPMPAFVAQVKRSQNFSRKQLEKADNEARKEQLRAIQIKVAWDSCFKDLTGDRVWLLTKRLGASSSNTSSSGNGPAGKRWIVTKTIQIEGKPVCWCIPVELKTGQEIDISFNKSNTFDLRTLYDNAMEEPVGIGDKEQIKKFVDDYVRENFPEITSRETIEWDDVAKAGDDNGSIRYKYLAKFQGKDTKIMNQIFTFDAKGKFVSVKDVDGFPKNW